MDVSENEGSGVSSSGYDWKLNRRQTLAVIGAAGASSLTGCLHDGDGEGPGRGETSEDAGAPPAAFDYDPADVIEVENAGAVDEGYEFERPDEEVELNDDIDEATTLSNDVVHVVTTDVTVTDSLTIDPGTIVEFQDGTEMEIDSGGEIIADGTADDPILLTGTQESPGWWDGLYIEDSDSLNNVLNYAVVEYGGGGHEANVHVGRSRREARVTVTNCTLRHSDGYGLFVHRGSSFPDSETNNYVGNDSGPVWTSVRNTHYLDGGSDYLGNGEDHVRISGRSVSGDATWDALNVAYRMEGSTEYSDGELEIGAGTLFLFHDDADFEFDSGSSIVAEGTDERPIVFSATDNTPGWWNGIYVEDSASANNHLSKALVEFGGGDNEAAVTVGRSRRDASLRLTNCTVRHSDSYGLFVHRGSELPDSAGNVYTGNESGAASVSARTAHFLDDTSDYTGNEEDVVDVAGRSVEKDASWDGINVPYRIDGTVEFSDNEVVIEPGAEILFREGAGMEFDSGSIFQLEGTADDPILFTGTQHQPGWWDGIYVSDSYSRNNSIGNVVVEYGGGERNGNLHVGRSRREAFVSVANSTFRHSGEWGVWVHGSSETNEDVCDINDFHDNAEGDCEIED